MSYYSTPKSEKLKLSQKETYSVPIPTKIWSQKHPHSSRYFNGTLA